MENSPGSGYFQQSQIKFNFAFLLSVSKDKKLSMGKMYECLAYTFTKSDSHTYMQYLEADSQELSKQH